MTKGINLRLELIRTDGGTQSRVSINTGRVKQYADDMQDGASFPALEVYQVGSEYYLVNGFHRLQAAKSIGLETFDVIVYEGTLREAVLYSKGVNKHTALERSVEDKRKIVTEMLQDSEWVKWSDREIARHCGVSGSFVGDMRNRLFPATVADYSTNDNRTYKKNGKTATMNTGGITEANHARAAKTVTYSANEDDYQSDVPEVEADTGEPARNASPFIRSYPINGHRGEPAVTPPGHTPPGHVDQMAGAHSTNGNGHSAPIPPPKYQHVRIGDKDVYMDASSRVLTPGEIVALLNTRPAPINAAPVEPTLSDMEAQMGLKAGDLTELASEHKPKVVLRLAQAAIEDGIDNGLEAITKTLLRWHDMEKGSPHKALFGAICKAFKYDTSHMTPTEKSGVGKVAKELAEVGADTLDPAGLFKYCASKFDNFTEKAFTSNWSAYRASDFHMRAHTMLVPDDDPITLLPPREPSEWELEPIPATGEERAKRAQEIFEQVKAMKHVNNGKPAVSQ